MKRPARLVPDDEGAGRFLPWVISVMAFLATLAMLGVLTLDRAMSSWQAGLAGNLTVEVPAATVESDPKRLDRALEVLAETEGVTGVRLLDEVELAALLAPWLGPDTPIADLPVPRLIDVEIDRARLGGIEDLRRRLAPTVPGVRIDDHRVWLEHLLALARGVQVVAALIITLIALAMATVVVFAVRAALAAHDGIVRLLHQMGAKDGFIARQFQNHALAMGLRGGLMGLALAVLTLFVLSRLAAAIELPFLPSLWPSPTMLAVLALVPLASGVIAFLTARLTVLSTLRRMP